jgi:hypothetical protein
MKINIINSKVIPHSEHRYETVGDYWYPNSTTMELRVSDMGNSDYEFLVQIHELIEAHLCRKRGISEPDIKAFDEAFEANREEGNEDEPGDSPLAPYQKEHQFATSIERQLAEALGVDWEAYDNAVMAL